jgi:hypothetical protein
MTDSDRDLMDLAVFCILAVPFVVIAVFIGVELTAPLA